MVWPSVPAVDARNPRAWLGAETRNDSGRLLVSSVRRETPALAAGLNVDDEILAIDDVRVRADGLSARLEQYRPGTEDRAPCGPSRPVDPAGRHAGDRPGAAVAPGSGPGGDRGTETTPGGVDWSVGRTHKRAVGFD